MDHLLGKPTFRPHSGRDWRYGVFLGDNARPLMTGIYFIFDRRAIEPTTGWKVANSPEMEEEIVRMAQKFTPPPKLNTYGGYTEVASKLHRRFPFYYPKEGVATLPWEIPVRAAKLILVGKDILSNYRKEIPDFLQEKVLPF